MGVYSFYDRVGATLHLICATGRKNVPTPAIALSFLIRGPNSLVPKQCFHTESTEQKPKS